VVVAPVLNDSGTPTAVGAADEPSDNVVDTTGTTGTGVVGADRPLSAAVTTNCGTEAAPAVGPDGCKPAGRKAAGAGPLAATTPGDTADIAIPSTHTNPYRVNRIAVSSRATASSGTIAHGVWTTGPE
jgi:hypothetical protein